MDPAVIVAMLSSAVAALFGALVFTMRQQREDWKALYDKESEKHEETRKTASAEVREAMTAIREIRSLMGDLMARFPKRRDDPQASAYTDRVQT